MEEIYNNNNNKELQFPKFYMPEKPKQKEERTIKKAKKFEKEKNYKLTKQKMINKVKKLMLIATASASLGVTAISGISIYNNQQITRQAESYEDQIHDYNHELYNKIQALEEEGLSDLSNEELRSLIEEVNENNYQAIKDKIAKVIPDCSGNLSITRHDSANSGSDYWVSYNSSSYQDNEFSLSNVTIQEKLDRCNDIRKLIDETENGDVDRSLLEKELVKLADEMKEDADIGVYVNTKDGHMKDNALKTYSISKNENKIEEKLTEMKKDDKSFDIEKD